VSRIFWDTNLFVYLVEDYGELSERVVTLRQRMLSRDDQLYTSTLTLGEILVKPTALGRSDLAQHYEALVASAAVVIPFTTETARVYAMVRRDRSVRPPDAIQLACAAQMGIDLFITNDERLSDKRVPGVQFVTSLGRAFV
jgi:predicted nucleic acid-binding protein